MKNNIEIIDAHHHLWIYQERDYGWMSSEMARLKRDHLPGELRELLPASRVKGTVAVQARQSMEESSWLLEMAEEHDFIKAVVGWLDLRSDQIDDQLQNFALHPKFVGVRHVLHDEPDVDFMLSPEFRRGISKLSSYKLTYDLLIFPEHLPNTLKLVREFPHQAFIIDHLAKPLIKEGKMEPWASDIAKLAKEPNVYCKISGMLTEADWKNWKYEDFVPYLDKVVEVFGTDRLMLGSDWPVCRLAGEYEQVFEIPLKYFSSFSDSEKENIFSKNCMAFYGLSDSFEKEETTSKI